MEHIFIVTAADVGLRIDKFISQQFTKLSRSKLQYLIKNGALTLNGQPFDDCSYIAQEGDHCCMQISAASFPSTTITPKHIEFGIAYEDEYMLVVNKPAGLTVHPGAGNHNDTLVNALVAYCGDNLAQNAAHFRPGLVHRLDRDTTGLLIVAKTDEAHFKLASALAQREIKRQYLALVYGRVSLPNGTITTLIDRSPQDRTRMTVSHNTGRSAITHYHVQQHYVEPLTLLSCQLQTGRTHQIRVHLTHKKHPIVGDQLYGRNLNFNLTACTEEAQQALKAFPRQALHAYSLDFIHPISEEPISLQVPMPDDMQNLIQLLTIEERP